MNQRKKIFKIVFVVLLIFSNQISNAQTILTDTKGTWTITPKDNTINVEFKPNADNVDCPDIFLSQTIKESYDEMTVTVPSSEYPQWAYRDDDALSDGTVIDHLFCEKDPYYNGTDSQDETSQGKAAGNGTATTSTKMYDPPFIPDSGFPGGKKMGKYEFETCAICRTGCVAIRCIKWKYERTKKAAGKGKVTLLSTMPETQTAVHKNAVTRFKTKHTSGNKSICPEDIPKGNCANRVYNKKGPLIFKVNDKYTVRSAGSGVKKGTDNPDSTGKLPSNPIGASVKAGDYIYVPANQRVCIRRNSDLMGPDPDIPFLATFTDLLEGELETVQSGHCLDAENCGIRVRNCADDATIAGVAPVETGDSTSLVVFSAEIVNDSSKVVIRNDLLSTHPIQAIDVLNGSSVLLLQPGEVTEFFYPQGGGFCFITSIPTLSEWGAFIFMLLLLFTGLVFIKKQQLALTPAGPFTAADFTWSVSIRSILQFPVKYLSLALLLFLAGFLLILAIYGEVTPVDLGGLSISALISAFFIQLLTIKTDAYA